MNNKNGAIIFDGTMERQDSEDNKESPTSIGKARNNSSPCN